MVKAAALAAAAPRTHASDSAIRTGALDDQSGLSADIGGMGAAARLAA
jgi:hypothetical protein